ncbi:MAG: hypothetical protein KF685_06175 [Acidobacteria bacterium]|nr:hypothetical protein [Acidobacteriota bacterium]
MEVAGTSFLAVIAITVGIGALTALFVGYVVFRMLKKSVKMALRLAMAAAVMAAVLIGVVSFGWFWMKDGQPSKTKPAATKKR